MADHDDPKQGPNPAFLRTKLLGSRSVDALDYEDEAPTGVDHKPSNRPAPRSGPPARVDPGDVYMLTEPPAQVLPSFADTVVGHGSMETPLTHLPPVAPIPGAPPQRVSPLAHSPTPPPPRGAWPTAPLPAVAEQRPAPSPATSSPAPPGRARRGLWKPVHPPPKYLSRPPVAKPIKPHPSVHERELVPVEDRLLNAILVLMVGVGVALGATWAFLNVTHTRAPALSDFITSPASSTPAP